MNSKGTDKNANIVISQRIEYLEKSKTSFENASSNRFLKEVKYILVLAQLQKEAYDTIHNCLDGYRENANRLSAAQRETMAGLETLSVKLNSILLDEISLFNDVTDKYKLIESSLKILVHSKKLKSNRLDLMSHYMKSYIYSLLPLNATPSSCNLFLGSKRTDLYKGTKHHLLHFIATNNFSIRL